MRNQLLAGAAFAALALPGAAFAQSTGSSEVENDIVVVAQRSDSSVNGIKIPESTKARQIITNELINRGAPGNTLLQSLNIVPGVNFTNNDPYGSSGGNIRIRGFDGSRISLTFDGFPLNDSGNYSIYSNQQLDPELVDEVNVNLGTTDIDSPTASASGGTINYKTIVPSDTLSASATAAYGDNNYTRAFGLIQTGVFTSFGTKAFASASVARNDKFKGPGEISKQQFNLGIYQPIGSNGDFIRVSGNYNNNRNAFYRNPNVGDLRSLAGGATIPAIPVNAAGTPFAGFASAPITIPTNLSQSQRDAVLGFEYAAICTAPCTNTNYQGVRINPSNTGSARLNSRFTATDKLTFFVDASYQYTLANGGGSSLLAENSARAKGSLVASPGVDYNGDGDFNDSVLFYAPNNTNTNRYTAIASALYELSDDHRVRVAYTYDNAQHRQTGEWGYLTPTGDPYSPFGGRTAAGRPVLTADGFALGQRDRKSVALLNQISGEYIGKFFDKKLTIQLGIRAPFFERNLQTFCPIQAKDGFAYCTTQPILAAGSPTPPAAGANNSIPIYVTQGTNLGTAPLVYNQLYAPFKANYKFSKVLPSAGFNFKFTDTLSAFGSYAQGLSAPRTDNLYRAPLLTITPETTDAFDLGFRYNSRFIQASAAGWHIYYKNRIVTSYDFDQGISIDRNIGSVDTWGADVGVTIRPAQFVALTGTASYTSTNILQNVPLGNGVFAPTAGKQVPETPEWQFGGRAQFYAGPIELGIQGKWVDKRYATDVNDVIVPSYTLIDLDLRYKMTDLGFKKTYVQLNVQNLFDEFYYGSISSQINAVGNSSSQPSLTVGYGRTITGSIHFEF
ncbi:TonB-dependent receptor [Sphingomonas immobilis]|uniref:TonB-dependent receptor n=1 Tax=Sphingomonas immobilis TaxID=3063997 RepID=A0ABT9A531_9SPHN|nr:TonB-dependent receptor [Sphingomonas sp. CA1-15]MDO7844071.1 TonB-dependent receptor [Sphingomonas sp. CA1-15]